MHSGSKIHLFLYHRVVLEVPNTRHCDLLPIISDRMPLRCTLELKYISFFRSIATSENPIIKYMAKHMLNINTSTMCRNMKYLCYKYEVSIDDILTKSTGRIRKDVYNKWFSGVNAEYSTHANVIKDMLGIKEERYTRILSNEECNIFIEFACTV